MKKAAHLAGLMAVLLTAAACGSTDLGGILGGGDSGGNTSYQEIRGTVDSVDLSSSSVLLRNVTTYNNNLANGGSGSSTRVYFDDRTAVEYQGRNYSPSDLERGDEIAVRVSQSGNRLMADSMSVLRDVSGSGDTGTWGNGSAVVRGQVQYVDTGRRTIEVRDYNRTHVVEYSTSTPVRFNGQQYRATDLERGDEIEIATTDLGGGRLRADEITVVRSVSSNDSWNNNSMARLRGSVRYLDTSRRSLELDQATWTSGFSSGAGSGSTVVVKYDDSTQVEYQGRTYSPSNLERGDVVDVEVEQAGTNTWRARRITVVRDVNAR